MLLKIVVDRMPLFTSCMHAGASHQVRNIEFATGIRENRLNGKYPSVTPTAGTAEASTYLSSLHRELQIQAQHNILGIQLMLQDYGRTHAHNIFCRGGVPGPPKVTQR